MPNVTFEEQGHIYRIDGQRVLSVTQALDGAGLIDKRFYTEGGASRGDDVHYLCKLIDDGEDISHIIQEFPHYQGYADAYNSFLDDTGVVHLLTEQIVYHIQARVAGRVDRFSKLYERPAIIDLKSGAVEDWAAIQMAGYEYCLSGMNVDLWTGNADRYALQLRKTGKYKLHHFKDRSDIRVFQSCVVVAQWKGVKNVA